MPERIPSDHPSVRTVDAELTRAGRTSRPRIAIPPEAADAFPSGEAVRLVLDGEDRFAPVAEQLSGGGIELRGAYDTPEAAHNPGSGTDRLAEWREAAGVRFGGSVHVDVVAEGYRYGLRAPGERAIYDAGQPDESLASIARDLQNE